MFDWLKTILGENYTDEIDQKVSKEIGKAFVPRSDFNEKNEKAKQLDAALKEAEKQIAERDKQLETLKESGAEGETLKAQLAEMEKANKEAEKARKKELEEAQAAHAAELTKLKRQTETREFMQKHQFVNDLTRDALMTAVETALDDPTNAGKSRQDILDSLTMGEDGKPRPDIFKQPDSPYKLVIPPAGGSGTPDAGEMKFNFTGVRPRQ